MPRRENTFRVDYSQFPKVLSHDEIHKFIAKNLGLTGENVLQLQPSRRLGCTFVKVNELEIAEKIVQQHDGKHEYVQEGKSYKIRITMEDGAVDVSLLDLPEDVTNDQISAFLVEYGEVVGVRDLLWDARYGDIAGVKTGVRVARMVVTKNIPSLVKIQGEETAVRYKGQRQTCLHCHEFAHIGIACVQNKKLLVQKLAADQSYAKVTKGKPSKAQQTETPKPSLTPAARASKTPSSIEQQGELIAKSNATTLRKNTMPPPVLPTKSKQSTSQILNILSLDPVSTETNLLERKTDGHDTDSSQTSQASNGSRRSARRQPPGKKMKTTGEMSAEQEHNEDADIEMQQ